MGARKTNRKIEAARGVAEKLRKAGDHAGAQAVEDLCRAHSMMAKTCSQLWHENRGLRIAAGSDLIGDGNKMVGDAGEDRP